MPDVKLAGRSFCNGGFHELRDQLWGLRVSLSTSWCHPRSCHTQSHRCVWDGAGLSEGDTPLQLDSPVRGEDVQAYRHVEVPSSQLHVWGGLCGHVWIRGSTVSFTNKPESGLFCSPPPPQTAFPQTPFSSSQDSEAFPWRWDNTGVCKKQCWAAFSTHPQVSGTTCKPTAWQAVALVSSLIRMYFLSLFHEGLRFMSFLIE